VEPFEAGDEVVLFYVALEGCVFGRCPQDLGGMSGTHQCTGRLPDGDRRHAHSVVSILAAVGKIAKGDQSVVAPERGERRMTEPAKVSVEEADADAAPI
jgi:hypothetical protein